MSERRINWPILMLIAFWMMVYAIAQPQAIVSAPGVDGGLALLEMHLMQNAPDTVFAMKPKKFFFTKARNASTLQIHLDSLFTNRIVLNVKQIVFDPTPRPVDHRVVMRAGDTRSFDYPADNVRVLIDCVNITKTQTRLRLYKMWLPLVADSIAVVPRTAKELMGIEAMRINKEQAKVIQSTPPRK